MNYGNGSSRGWKQHATGINNVASSHWEVLGWCVDDDDGDGGGGQG